MTRGKDIPIIGLVVLLAFSLAWQWRKARKLDREVTVLTQRAASFADQIPSGTTGRPAGNPHLIETFQNPASPESLVETLKVGTFGGIDFGRLPTEQEGMDGIFIKIFSETGQTRRKRLYTLLLDSLTPEQAPLLWNSMRLRGRLGVAGHEEYRWLWDRWGDIDGPAAAATAFKIDGDDGYHSTQVTNIAIKSWARHEPLAAIEWLAEQENIPLKTGMREGLLAGIMDYHPDRAEALLEAFNPTEKEQTTARELTATRISRERGPEALDAWLASLPEDLADRPVIEAHVNQIHLDHGVAHAVAWAADDPAQFSEVLGHFARYRPEPLFEHYAAQTGPLGTPVTNALKQAAARWTEKNPDLMGIWLRDKSQSSQYDAMTEIFVDTIREVDPDAARAWAETTHQ
ncbi:MAG: hypothetical protein AAF514_07965 [Verrucomicrobiota bacterium]